jgi:hypothetical protein
MGINLCKYTLHVEQLANDCLKTAIKPWLMVKRLGLEILHLAAKMKINTLQGLRIAGAFVI